MKIIKTRFNITKLPAGKVVRQFDIDNIAEKSFVKKFGDKPAYMGYGMEGSGSLAARDYAEKVANRVYFKKLKSELIIIIIFVKLNLNEIVSPLSNLPADNPCCL